MGTLAIALENLELRFTEDYGLYQVVGERDYNKSEKGEGEVVESAIVVFKHVFLFITSKVVFKAHF